MLWYHCSVDKIQRLTETVPQTFVEVLANSENNFTISLEKLTLKKSANNELFEPDNEQRKSSKSKPLSYFFYLLELYPEFIWVHRWDLLDVVTMDSESSRLLQNALSDEYDNTEKY